MPRLYKNVCDGCESSEETPHLCELNFLEIEIKVKFKDRLRSELTKTVTVCPKCATRIGIEALKEANTWETTGEQLYRLIAGIAQEAVDC